MTRIKTLTIIAIAFVGPYACGSGQSTATPDEGQAPAAAAPDNTATKSQDPELEGAVVTPGAPYRINYTIIGTPVVGVPIAIDLTIDTATARSEPVILEYDIRDASSMLFADSQPESVRLEPAANETSYRQQVSVIPQREGRFYLNVSASYETEDGTMSTVTAIPVQVGKGGREVQEEGQVEIDEQGEAVRVLTSD